MTVSRYFLTFIFMVLLCLAFVGIRVQVLRLGYGLSASQGLNRDLLHENSQMKIECATLKNPERIERIAQGELGMVYPDQEHIIQIDE